MTREEAKEALSVLKIYDNQWLREAIDMAIEALSAKPQTDLISRADALRELNGACSNWEDDAKVAEIINALPSADAEQGEWYDDAVKANHELAFTDLPDIPRYYYEKVVGKMAHEINILKAQLESADAVPQLRQTDTLIIADALRYLAKDTERHLVDRTRADALRQQFLKYGASMCKGGAE